MTVWCAGLYDTAVSSKLAHQTLALSEVCAQCLIWLFSVVYLLLLLLLHDIYALRNYYYYHYY
jgi:hypothetical protein